MKALRVKNRLLALVATAALPLPLLVAPRRPLSHRPARRLEQVGGTGPMVNVTAMHGRDELAFVSRGDLYLLDGATGRVDEVPVGPGRTAVGPTFSPDGKWVAFQTESYAFPASRELWVARSNGTDRRQVIAADGYYGWDPGADLLAISTDSTYTQVLRGSTYRESEAARLELVSPTGARRQLLSLPMPAKPVVWPPPGIWDASWSPSGDAIAVAVDSFHAGSSIRSYPLDGGKPTTWFSINGTAQLPGLCSGCGGGNTIAQLAGWWPKWGVGFWAFCCGSVHGNDAAALELVQHPGASPHIIGRTLSDGTTEVVSSASTGALAIVASTLDAGRSYGIGKEVDSCALSSGTCTPIPGASVWTGPGSLRCAPYCSQWPAPGKPGSAVSLDPAWSPDGKLLAYVKSPSADTGGWPSLAWFDAHKLLVFDPATGRSTELAGVSGVSVPTWSRDGRDLLYVSGDALWLVPASGGRATEVVSPLFPTNLWRDV
ncbi:MAG TPA: hypothetical protein VK425_10565, partial [Acidimicrobiales bacterium]|nr:hypothetical protein [Acidimicrobiales bacterium]